MALHLKYRPDTFEKIIGNDSIKTSIKTLMANDERPHSYLLHGPSGSGKTTLARIMAKMLGCSEIDYNEFNTGNVRGIDSIREMLQNCQYAGMDSKIKLYVYDECHRLTKDAQEALLKALEDTPNHVYFILCTTDPEQLIPTIRNRCTSFQVSKLIISQMKQLLNDVLKQEGVSDFSEKVMKEIIRVADGCPRQALVVLDSVLDIVDEKKALEAVDNMIFTEAEVIDICRALMGKTSWKVLRNQVKAVINKTEPEQLRHMILGYLTTILLSSDVNLRVSDMICIFSENTYASGKAGIVNMLYSASNL